MPKEKSDGELISQAEAARLLGVTRSAVSYLVDDNKLRSESIAGRRLVYRSAVVEYGKTRAATQKAAAKKQSIRKGKGKR